MKIALLGATGHVGAQILREAIARGHHVTGVARHLDKLPQGPLVSGVVADANDPAAISAAVAGHEVVIRSLPFRAVAAERVIDAVKRSGVARFVAVGGAGSLEVAPGRQLVDQPDFPAAYRTEALGGRTFLEALRRERELDWTFLAPSAVLEDGPRTGKFRLGDDALLVDEHGHSHVSVADLAVALLDEVEHPRHTRRRFTVGY